MPNLYQYNGKKWEEIAKNGEDGYSPIPGVDFEIPKNGKDGSPDTGLEIKAKLLALSEEDRLKLKDLGGFDELIRSIEKFGVTKNSSYVPYSGITTTFFALNGENKGRAKNINFVTGSTLNVTLQGDTATITIPTGGGGGSGTVTAITAQNSITATPNPITGAGTINLVNDSTAPGNSKYYGTNGAGTKGFFNLPSGVPGGLDTNVQYNDGGVFGGDVNFIWDKTAKDLFAGDASLTKGLLIQTSNDAFGMGDFSTGNTLQMLTALGTFTVDFGGGNGTNWTIDDGSQTYTLNKLGGSGTRFVTADPSGVLGTSSTISPSVLPLTQYHIFNGSSSNTAQDSGPNFLWNETLKIWRVGDLTATGNGSLIELDDNNNSLLTMNLGFWYIFDNTGIYNNQIATMGVNPQWAFGDLNGTGNSVIRSLSDGDKTVFDSIETSVQQTDIIFNGVGGNPNVEVSAMPYTGVAATTYQMIITAVNVQVLYLDYPTITGTFNVGDTVTGAPSGASGVIVYISTDNATYMDLVVDPAGSDDFTGDTTAAGVFPSTGTANLFSVSAFVDSFHWTDSVGGSGNGVTDGGDNNPGSVFAYTILSDNVTVRFNALFYTGHTIGDTWDWSYDIAPAPWLKMEGQKHTVSLWTASQQPADIVFGIFENGINGNNFISNRLSGFYGNYLPITGIFTRQSNSLFQSLDTSAGLSRVNTDVFSGVEIYRLDFVSQYNQRLLMQNNALSLENSDYGTTYTNTITLDSQNSGILYKNETSGVLSFFSASDEHTSIGLSGAGDMTFDIDGGIQSATITDAASSALGYSYLTIDAATKLTTMQYTDGTTYNTFWYLNPTIAALQAIEVGGARVGNVDAQITHAQASWFDGTNQNSFVASSNGAVIESNNNSTHDAMFNANPSNANWNYTTSILGVNQTQGGGYADNNLAKIFFRDFITNVEARSVFDNAQAVLEYNEITSGRVTGFRALDQVLSFGTYVNGNGTLIIVDDIGQDYLFNKLATGGATQVVTADSTGILGIASNYIAVADHQSFFGLNGSATVAGINSPPADVTLQVSAFLNITAISAGTLTLQIAYTDENNVPQVETLYSNAGLNSFTATGVYAFPAINIRAKAGTSAILSSTFTGTSITYDIGGAFVPLP